MRCDLYKEKRAKEYLSRVRSIDASIHFFERFIQDNQNSLDILTGFSSPEAREAVSMLERSITENQRKIAAERDEKQRIESALEKLDPIHSAIIREHYLKGRTWRQIAPQIGYCENHIYRKGREALTALYDLIF